MIKVYFEFQKKGMPAITRTARIVATFNTESEYMKELPSLRKQVKLEAGANYIGMITESED